MKATEELTIRFFKPLGGPDDPHERKFTYFYPIMMAPTYYINTIKEPFVWTTFCLKRSANDAVLDGVISQVKEEVSPAIWSKLGIGGKNIRDQEGKRFVEKVLFYDMTRILCEKFDEKYKNDGEVNIPGGDLTEIPITINPNEFWVFSSLADVPSGPDKYLESKWVPPGVKYVSVSPNLLNSTKTYLDSRMYL